jgi:N-acetyl-anhydromuramyl-L-alanine amidase AmpD
VTGVLKVIGRDEWKARAPLEPFKKRKETLLLVIHHTASSKISDIDEKQAMRDLQAFHQRKEADGGRGFIDIGYHFVVFRSGNIYEGRPVDVVGAHLEYFNSKSIGITLYGNYDLIPMSAEQYTALRDLCDDLLGKYQIERKNLIGHRDRGVTKCPGSFVYWKLEDLRKDLWG